MPRGFAKLTVIIIPSWSGLFVSGLGRVRIFRVSLRVRRGETADDAVHSHW